MLKDSVKVKARRRGRRAEERKLNSEPAQLNSKLLLSSGHLTYCMAEADSS